MHQRAVPTAWPERRFQRIRGTSGRDGADSAGSGLHTSDDDARILPEPVDEDWEFDHGSKHKDQANFGMDPADEVDEPEHPSGDERAPEFETHDMLLDRKALQSMEIDFSTGRIRSINGEEAEEDFFILVITDPRHGALQFSQRRWQQSCQEGDGGEKVALMVAMNPELEVKCSDHPDWLDADGDDCEVYKAASWCTRVGVETEAWKGAESQETLNDAKYKDAASALDACCVCGGGIVDVKDKYGLLKGRQQPVPAPVELDDPADEGDLDEYLKEPLTATDAPAPAPAVKPPAEEPAQAPAPAVKSPAKEPAAAPAPSPAPAQDPMEQPIWALPVFPGKEDPAPLNDKDSAPRLASALGGMKLVLLLASLTAV